MGQWEEDGNRLALYELDEIAGEPDFNDYDDDGVIRLYESKTNMARVNRRTESLFGGLPEFGSFSTEDTFSNVPISNIQKFENSIGISKRAGIDKNYWVTSAGIPYRPVEMDDKHLLNTIRFIRKRAKAAFPRVPTLAKLDVVIDELVPTWAALMKEVNKRGLDTFDPHLFGDRVPVNLNESKYDITASSHNNYDVGMLAHRIQSLEGAMGRVARLENRVVDSEDARSLYKSAVTRITNLEDRLSKVEEKYKNLSLNVAEHFIDLENKLIAAGVFGEILENEKPVARKRSRKAANKTVRKKVARKR